MAAAKTWFGLRQHELVSCCFKPSQPQRITSGLKETFTKRYIVERTNKAETDSMIKEIRTQKKKEKA